MCLLLAMPVLSQTSDEKTEVHIRINQIHDSRADTLWLTLDAGSDLGIEKGTKGTALQVYKSKDREYKLLGTITVTKVDLRTSQGYVIPKDTIKKPYLVVGDQVVFTALPQKWYGKKENGLLQQLAAFNIQFANLNSEPFYTQKQLLSAGGRVSFDSLLAIFQKDIIETAASLKEIESKPADWTKPQEKGKFKGLSLIAALENTNALDVESFLHFVREFPGKYIGHKWKLNETYATWVINDMPTPEDKSYMGRAFLKLSDKQIPAWATANRFYYDSLFKTYLTAFIDNYIEKKHYDSTEWLLSKIALLADIFKDQPLQSIVYTNKGIVVQARDGASKYEAALAHYNKAISLDSLYWAPYWHRGSLYAEMEVYAKAISDFKVLNRFYPGYANAWGNQGWWYLKQFKIKEARLCCLKAYELEPESAAWAVNLAHYYVLAGQKDSARFFYERALENTKTESEFINGALADFAFFAERGVLQESFIIEKDWMLQQFNANYKHYFRADSFFKIAKEDRTKGDFKLAAANFTKSLEAEKAATKQRQLTIHNVMTWIGYMQVQLKEYEKGEAIYLDAVAMAQKDFPTQLANDFELLTELYKKSGNKALADSYESQSLAWKQKAREGDKKKRDLYVVSIGVDQYRDLSYRWAASDAKNIASAFAKKGTQFETVHAVTLTNKEAIGDSVDKAMREVIANAKEDDTFVFYFTGKTANNETESYLLPYGINKDDADSLLLKKAIPAELLHSWSKSINAKHQLFLLDAAASNFSSVFAAKNSPLSKTISPKDLVIVCATFPRIEKKETASGIIAASIQKLFSDSVFNIEKVITGKRIESFFADEITRNNYHLSLESFSQGRDFILAKADAEMESPHPVASITTVSNTRGTSVENDDPGTSNYTVNKRYGVFIATDNYADPKWTDLNNPISDADALRKLLEEEYGFEIEILPNPTKAQIADKIDEYSKKKFEKNDQLVILFAGHGYYDDRRNEGYLVPTDAPYTQNRLDDAYYPMSNIMRDLKIIPANHIMVLMDVCHGGAICDNAMMRSGSDDYSALSVNALLKKHLEFPNRLILTSGRKDQRVPDGIKGKNSPFIAAILNALRSAEAKRKGYTSYYQLIDHIGQVQKTQATSAMFSATDNWNFMFFYGGSKKNSPIDPTGGSKNP